MSVSQGGLSCEMVVLPRCPYYEVLHYSNLSISEYTRPDIVVPFGDLRFYALFYASSSYDRQLITHATYRM